MMHGIVNELIENGCSDPPKKECDCRGKVSPTLCCISIGYGLAVCIQKVLLRSCDKLNKRDVDHDARGCGHAHRKRQRVELIHTKDDETSKGRCQTREGCKQKSQCRSGHAAPDTHTRLDLKLDYIGST